MERQRYIVIAAFALLAAALMVGTVIADPSAPTNVDKGAPERRDLSTLQTQTVDAYAGNVTQINLTALSITKGWQGYYGNIAGTLVLQNAANYTFYDWNVSTPKGQVYATRVAGPTWAGTTCLGAAGITTEEGTLNMAATDADSVTNTFDNTTSTHPAFEVGSTTIGASSCYATNAYVDNATQSAAFSQVLLADGASNVVYTTLINDSTTGFDSNSWDFELLVGEDGHNGDTAATPYYFWVELN